MMFLIIKHGIFGGKSYYIDDGLFVKKVTKTRGEYLVRQHQIKLAARQAAKGGAL